MCFSIPLKVVNTIQNTAYLEGGRAVRLDPDIKTKPGDYLQISGDLALRNLTAREGKNIRSLIANLNKNYER